MKKTLLAAVLLSVLGLNVAKATVNFSDNFNSYVNGNLAGTVQDTVGQGTWAQTSTANATPIQVNGGTAVIGTSGQDVYSPLASQIAITDGASFFIGADIFLTAAQAGGDYFLHWSTPVGTTTTFVSRIFARSSASGFQLGYVVTSGGGVIAYGTDVLNFNSTYRIVLGYNSVTGPLNDTFSLYVNPSDTSVEGNNTAYLSGGYAGSGTAESTTVQGINLRQGGAANAPSVILDNLNVTTTFAEAAVYTAIPEPTTAVLAGIGALLLVNNLRRRR